MSHTPPISVTARKQHKCTNCGEAIVPGQVYKRWVSFDDSAFTNKMHPECLAACQADDLAGECGQWEYTPGEGERPAVGEFGRSA